MSKYSLALRAEYDAQIDLYRKFTKKNEEILKEILTENKIDFYSVDGRTKTLDSFEAKIDSPEKEQKYTNFSEVTDLSGIRIICYLPEDVQATCDILKRVYSVDAANSINKDTELGPNQFGYRSHHFVVSYKDDRTKLMDFKKFEGLKAEIQVRTILQHAWAAIDWKLRYKTALEAPQEIRRRIFRVSALLELADDEFSYLSKAANDLRSSYEQKIKAGDYAIGLDRESVDLFLASDDKLDSIVNRVTKIGYSIAPNHPNARDPYGLFLASLQWLGMEKVDMLRDLISPIAIDDAGKFDAIFKKWKKPDRPAKLVISKASLARLSAILAQDSEKSSEMLNLFPFGDKLQEAVLEAIKK